MLAFYDVDKDYVKYLKTIDPKVPNVTYDSNNKFVCGVVFELNGICYYAPVSHMTNKQRTNLLIYDGEAAIASIRFAFMFPAYESVLYQKDFSVIAKTDPKYANLLAKEYGFCVAHSNDIYSKASSVYRIGCNKNHILNVNCCDFRKLEEHYKKFIK